MALISLVCYLHSIARGPPSCLVGKTQQTLIHRLQDSALARCQWLPQHPRCIQEPKKLWSFAIQAPPFSYLLSQPAGLSSPEF